MEAVGARLGRSSTRYGGPSTVFTGKVRKWKKKWVPLSKHNPNNNSSNNHNNSNSNSNNNGNNNNNPSHLFIYKWTPLSRDSAATDAAAAPPEEPPRKKFRYVPVTVIEEQKQEEAAAAAIDVKSDDEGKLEWEAAATEAQQMETDGAEEMNGGSDVNDEEDKVLHKDEGPAGEVQETNWDLNLGLKDRDGDSGNDPKTGDDKANNKLER